MDTIKVKGYVPNNAAAWYKLVYRDAKGVLCSALVQGKAQALDARAYFLAQGAQRIVRVARVA